jgi:hypothetical protein
LSHNDDNAGSCNGNGDDATNDPTNIKQMQGCWKASKVMFCALVDDLVRGGTLSSIVIIRRTKQKTDSQVTW